MSQFTPSNKQNSQTTLSPENSQKKTWRDLSPEESQRLSGLIKKKWGLDGYWHPIKKEQQPADVISVWLGYEDSPGIRIIPDSDSTSIQQLEQRIITLLKDKGYERIFCLNYDGETEENAEWDVSDFSLSLNGEEVWCPAGAEWLIYTSHEHTLAFGGSWLAAEIAPLLPPLGLVEGRQVFEEVAISFDALYFHEPAPLGSVKQSGNDVLLNIDALMFEETTPEAQHDKKTWILENCVLTFANAQSVKTHEISGDWSETIDHTGKNLEISEIYESRQEGNVYSLVGHFDSTQKENIIGTLDIIADSFTLVWETKKEFTGFS